MCKWKNNNNVLYCCKMNPINAQKQNGLMCVFYNGGLSCHVKFPQPVRSSQPVSGFAREQHFSIHLLNRCAFKKQRRSWYACSQYREDKLRPGWCLHWQTSKRFDALADSWKEKKMPHLLIIQFNVGWWTADGGRRQSRPTDKQRHSEPERCKDTMTHMWPFEVSRRR